jgi:hypothetical protein
MDAFKDHMTNITETHLSLTEKDLIKNISKVFPNAPGYFGKILYMYMSNGYDRVKISFLRFCECMYPLVNPDNRFVYNKLAYNILDIDRDGCLNILNLI